MDDGVRRGFFEHPTLDAVMPEGWDKSIEFRVSGGEWQDSTCSTISTTAPNTPSRSVRRPPSRVSTVRPERRRPRRSRLLEMTIRTGIRRQDGTMTTLPPRRFTWKGMTTRPSHWYARRWQRSRSSSWCSSGPTGEGHETRSGIAAEDPLREQRADHSPHRPGEGWSPGSGTSSP